MTTSRTRRSALVGVAVAVIAAVWWLAWPATLGGRTTYVMTHGISMQPRFHTGDLAVLRPTDTYRVGDIAAYHSAILHSVVMHRIVAIHDDHYTFKGDNNSWVDPQPPTRSALIGKLVLRVPQGGVWLRRLITAPLLAMLAFAATGARGVRHRRRRKGQMSRHAAPRGRPQRTAPATSGSPVLPIVAATAAVLATGGLMAAAWLLPTTHLRPQRISQTRTMAVSYSAAVRPSPAYDGTVVAAPQPVFRSVTDLITLRARYRGASGRMRIDAQLSTPGGWTSTITFVRPFNFNGDFTSVQVPMSLTALDRRAQAASKVTGLPATPVTITVIPSVTDGTGHVFAPQFPLTLTSLALTAADPTQLMAKDSVVLAKITAAPATISVLRHTISVASARRLTTAAFTLAVLAAVALLGAAKVHRSRGEADRIQRRWRELLLDVEPIPTPPGRPVVDVPAFSALARLAQRYELLIMHWARSGVHTYVVQDDATVFRYRTVGSAAETDSAEDASSESGPHRSPQMLDQHCERKM